MLLTKYTEELTHSQGDSTHGRRSKMPSCDPIPHRNDERTIRRLSASIAFQIPGGTSTKVSCGPRSKAQLSALSVDYCAMGNTLFLRHKATGLPKHAYCSLGFVRDDPVLKRTTETDEEWDQKYKRSWGEETETPGVNDGEVYIKGAIDWFCKVVSKLVLLTPTHLKP